MIPLFLAGAVGKVLIPAAVGVMIGGWGAWSVQSYRYGVQIATLKDDLSESKQRHISDLKAVSDAAVAAAAVHAATTLRMQTEISVADRKHSEELRDATARNNAIRADVRAGTRRLRVDAVCHPSGGGRVSGTTRPPGVANGGAAQAELHRETADRLLALTQRADEIAVQLRALQDYTRATTRRP